MYNEAFKILEKFLIGTLVIAIPAMFLGERKNRIRLDKEAAARLEKINHERELRNSYYETSTKLNNLQIKKIEKEIR